VTTLTVRNVDPALKERQRVRAAHNGRSMESELRHILSTALAADKGRESNLADAIRRRFAPLGGIDLEPHPRQPVGESPSFDG
jgi:plasmid stability protein